MHALRARDGQAPVEPGADDERRPCEAAGRLALEVIDDIGLDERRPGDFEQGRVRNVEAVCREGREWDEAGQQASPPSVQPLRRQAGKGGSSAPRC